MNLTNRVRRHSKISYSGICYKMETFGMVISGTIEVGVDQWIDEDMIIDEFIRRPDLLNKFKKLEKRFDSLEKLGIDQWK